MILTDGDGRPFEKPAPEDYPSAVEYMRAYHAYQDAVADCANQAFDSALRAALRKDSRVRVRRRS